MVVTFSELGEVREAPVATRRLSWYPTSCSVQTRVQLVWPRPTRSSRSASRSTSETWPTGSPAQRTSYSRRSVTMRVRSRWLHRRQAREKTAVTLSSLQIHSSRRLLPNSAQPPQQKEHLSPGPTSIRSSPCSVRGRSLNSDRQSRARISNLYMWLQLRLLEVTISTTQTPTKNCVNQTSPLTICSCSSRKRAFLAARANFSQCSPVKIKAVWPKTQRCQASCKVVSHQTPCNQPITSRIT